MDDKNKKILAAVLVAVSLLVMVVAFVKRNARSDIPDTFKDETVWVKCINKDCQAVEEVNKKMYYEYVQKNQDHSSLSAPPMVCKKCNQKSAYKAIKCKKCGNIFFEGDSATGYSDSCTKCGFSEKTQGRKK